MTGNELEARIIQVIQDAVRDKGKVADAVTRQSRVDERLGLDSLDWAAIVVRLEDELGVDPFRQRSSDIRCVGDLIDLYRKTMSGQ